MSDGTITAAPPRFMIAAAASGSGKTTITSGLLRCLARRGLAVVAYKCGPDYIDPMFHRSVLGTPCYNLDGYFSTPDQFRALLCQRSTAADISVLEGVMGFYDGLAGTDTQASAYQVARDTATPVFLVMDGRGTSLTIASLISGIQGFREQSNIAGVIFNRCSAMSFKMLAGIVEKECGIPAVGYLPKADDVALESRHLGLVTAGEVDDLQQRIDRVADLLEEGIDFQLLLSLASQAPELTCVIEPVEPVASEGQGPTIAVAQDDAFCFYYEESLEYLRSLGARILPFSPLSDSQIPEEADACYLGGGYPELYAAQLAANEGMRASLKQRYDEGMPLFAECGGFLYLKESLEDMEEKAWPMASILPGSSRYTGKLSRFGYLELEARCPGMGLEAGDRIRAHEFHYYDSDDNGQDFHGVKPISGKGWDCGVLGPGIYAGFPHLYLPAAPGFARGFVEAALAYKANREKGTECR